MTTVIQSKVYKSICACAFIVYTHVTKHHYIGVGPAKAIALIRQYKNIEEIMKHNKVCYSKILRIFAMFNLQSTISHWLLLSGCLFSPLEIEYPRELAVHGTVS